MEDEKSIIINLKNLLLTKHGTFPITLRTILHEYPQLTVEEAQRIFNVFADNCTPSHSEKFYSVMFRNDVGYQCEILKEEDIPKDVQIKNIYCVIGQKCSRFPHELVHTTELRNILKANAIERGADLSLAVSRFSLDHDSESMDIAAKMNGLSLKGIKDLLAEFDPPKQERKESAMCAAAAPKPAINRNRQSIKHKATSEYTLPTKKMKQSSLTAFFGKKTS
ncbi:hypothetical protein ACOME3_002691 [Neoechinorhynchus agilis]